MKPPRLRKVALLVLLFCALEVAKRVVFRAYVDKRVLATNLNARPLPDVMHELLPDWRAHYVWSDVAVFALMGLFCAFTLRRGSWDALLDAAVVVLIANLAKLGLNACTIHPDPAGGQCRGKTNFGGLTGQCNDLFPSGHMVIASAILFGVWAQTADKVWRGLFLGMACALGFVLLATRDHYTIDCIASPALVWLIWRLYM